MAIDTRNKRASCISLVLQNRGHILPNPDASIDQADRQQCAFVYCGILASPPVAIVWFNGITTSMRLTGAGSA